MDLLSDEEDSFQFLRPRPFNPLDTTVEEEEAAGEVVNIPLSACADPIKSYVDDFNTVENLRLGEALRHVTTGRQRIKVRALKSEMQFVRVGELAEEIGMKVNNNKTQTLCIHSDKSSEVSSYINAGSGTVESGEMLKILGLYFNTEPNAIKHVTVTIEKFYRKLWTLRFPKGSGMDTAGLLKIYGVVIRSAVEYCSVVYHSLIPKYMSDRLEQIQKQAMRIIFGRGVNYRELLEQGMIDSLETRRIDSCTRFANRAKNNPRFVNRWFPPNMVTRGVRAGTRRKYIEKRHKTEWSRNNPIQYMLNEQESQS